MRWCDRALELVDAGLTALPGPAAAGRARPGSSAGDLDRAREAFLEAAELGRRTRRRRPVRPRGPRLRLRTVRLRGAAVGPGPDRPARGGAGPLGADDSVPTAPRCWPGSRWRCPSRRPTSGVASWPRRRSRWRGGSATPGRWPARSPRTATRSPGPAYVDLREQQAGEIVALARRVPDVGLELLGLRLRVIARLERGDLVAARLDIAEFERLVERLRQPFFSWYAVLWRGLEAHLAGDLDDDGRCAAEVGRLGRARRQPQRDRAQRRAGRLAADRARPGRRGDGAARWTRSATCRSWPATAARWSGSSTDSPPRSARRRCRCLPQMLENLPVDKEWLPNLAGVVGGLLGAGHRRRARPAALRRAHAVGRPVPRRRDRSGLHRARSSWSLGELATLARGVRRRGRPLRPGTRRNAAVGAPLPGRQHPARPTPPCSRARRRRATTKRRRDAARRGAGVLPPGRDRRAGRPSSRRCSVRPTGHAPVGRVGRRLPPRRVVLDGRVARTRGDAAGGQGDGRPRRTPRAAGPGDPRPRPRRRHRRTAQVTSARSSTPRPGRPTGRGWPSSTSGSRTPRRPVTPTPRSRPLASGSSCWRSWARRTASVGVPDGPATRPSVPGPR